MKKIITLVIITAIYAFPAICQEDDKIEALEKLENVSEDAADDTSMVEIGNKVFSVKEAGDETIISLGKNEYRFVEDNDGVSIYRNKKHGDDDAIFHRRSDRFRGHLGGLEFGFNGYLTDFWSTSLEPEDYYLDLNTAKSNAWNFIFPCVSIGITRHVGFAAAIGLNFNKYRFDGNNSITKDENGVIGPSYPEQGITYTRTKLATTYATLPVLFEGQIPVNSSKTINIGAGVIGAVKLGSHTKAVYYEGGKQKEKRKDDFSLNVLRWGATGRIGYEFFHVYGTCYFTSMFEKGKGPQLYPFEVGVALTFNN